MPNPSTSTGKAQAQERQKNGFFDVVRAASRAAGEATMADSWENYSLIVRSKDTGELSFTAPRKVKGYSPMSGTLDYTVPEGTVLAAITHGHNVGFHVWVKYYPNKTWDDYLPLTRMLSPGDQNVSADRGVPIFAYAADGSIHGFNARTMPVTNANSPGYTVPTPE